MKNSSTPPRGDTSAPVNVMLANGETITADELRARVSLHEPGIAVLREVSHGTPATLDVMIAEVREQVDTTTAFAVIVPLGEITSSTDGAYRRYIQQSFQRLGPVHVGAVMASNAIAKIVTQFLSLRMGVKLTMHDEFEQALAAVRKSLERAT